MDPAAGRLTLPGIQDTPRNPRYVDETIRPDEAPELLDAIGEAEPVGPDAAGARVGVDPSEAVSSVVVGGLGGGEAPGDSGEPSRPSVDASGPDASADHRGDQAEAARPLEVGPAAEPRAAVGDSPGDRGSVEPGGRPGVVPTNYAGASGRRVLLADNDPNVAAILELFLRKSGAEVVSVPHGQAALEALAAEGFGLLVCDLDMPVMSGEELLDRIGSDPSTPPVFVISGYVDEVTSARLRSHRAVIDVLRKPFDLRAFAARVGDLLDGRGKSDPAPGIGLFSEA